jgi:hypothetical protein
VGFAGAKDGRREKPAMIPKSSRKEGKGTTAMLLFVFFPPEFESITPNAFPASGPTSDNTFVQATFGAA